MEDEGDNIFGAGTDLVVSLAAVFAVIIAMLTATSIQQRQKANADGAQHAVAIQKAETCLEDLGVANAKVNSCQTDLEMTRAVKIGMETELSNCKARLNACLERPDPDQINSERQKLLTELSRLTAKNENLKRELEKATSVPPIITLDSQVTFDSNSYRLNNRFRSQIPQTILTIEKQAREYGLYRVEVVGHTDGVRIGSNRTSNLDTTLLDGRPGVRGRPADNVGLGMLRALVIADELRTKLSDPRYEVVPLSAGPLLGLDGKYDPSSLSRDDRRRRRIEIRLRRRSTN